MRALNGFLATLARALPCIACRNGSMLAIDLFSHMSRGTGAAVMPATVVTYGILMDCCYRSRLRNLVLFFFCRILRLELQLTAVTYNHLLKGLCEAKRMEQALGLMLHRTPDLGCAPDSFSLPILLNSFCNNRRSRKALELLQMMAKVGGGCPPDVISYNTDINGLCLRRAR